MMVMIKVESFAFKIQDMNYNQSYLIQKVSPLYIVSEMEDELARPLTKICSQAIREYSLIKHAEINFDTIISIMYVKEMPNLQTHTTHTHQWFIQGCKVLQLKRGRQKGQRRQGEEWSKNKTYDYIRIDLIQNLLTYNLLVI